MVAPAESQTAPISIEGRPISDSRPLIVHVVYRFAIGGLENGLVNLLNGLPRDSWRHAVVALSDVEPSFASRVTRHDVDFIAFNKGPGHGFGYYRDLMSILRSRKPTVVHTRNLAALEMQPAVWMAGSAFRLHSEHGRDAADPSGTSVRRRLIRTLYRHFVQRYVTVSPDLKAYLCDRVRIPESRVEQIWNGVDTEKFSPRSERGLIQGCPFQDRNLILIGTVGRLDPVKDQANLARGFATLLAKAPHLRERLRLVIVGEGTERPTIERVLEEGGARDLTWMPGERHDVDRVLEGLDMFVLPSFGEGVSNVLLEAMATGLPIIATEVGSNGELVRHSESGTIVPPRNFSALGAAIEQYVLDPAMARRHGRLARERVEREFSLSRMISRYHELYTACANSTRNRWTSASRRHPIAPH